MPLRFEHRAELTLPVDLAGITPEWARDQRLEEIERREVLVGNHRMPLAELFAVSGDPSDAEIDLVGDLSRVHAIGAGMTSGTIRVEGDVGRQLGAEMSGGKIHVMGHAGDWLGREMRGGRIHVAGNAGDFAGGSPAAARRGMSGGELLIAGNAGDEVGRAMRRGLIVVGGAAGDSLGLNMVAGTALVFGRCGPRPGLGMRRGTIGLFTAPAELPLTFRRANRWRPQFMRLLLNYVCRIGMTGADQFLDSEYLSYHGDLLRLGKGEILVREMIS
ncbi:MAG TPA: formylmethanofuran dehydrogenase subunit C [Pirellulales bacterium]|jgi:formylmethanofuran dehydrogenase subunit C|nr:formylmethanofuran dehydrogenase subunit C [Pirellulales bacterium]